MFDPYEKWLDIPKDKRPIDFFVLLDLDRSETDPEAIHEAAEKQSERLSPHEDGPHAQACARLLKEIEQARATLVNPAKRKAYKAGLRKNAGKGEPEEENAGPARRLEEDDKKKGVGKAGKNSRKAKAAQKAARFKLWAAIGGGTAVLAIVGVLVYLLTGTKTSDAPAAPSVANAIQPGTTPNAGTPQPTPGPMPNTPQPQPAPKIELPKSEPPVAKTEPPAPKTEPPAPKTEPATKPPAPVALNRPAERKLAAKVAKLPVPGQAAQESAEKAIQEEYKALYAKAKQEDSKSPSEKAKQDGNLALSVTFLQPGRENRSDPASWFVLLREARDAAVRALRPRLAVEAIDEIDRWFVVDPFDLKLQALAKIGESADEAAARAVMKTALDQVDEAITAGNAAAAQRLIDAAEAVGRKRKSNDLQNLLRERRLDLEAFQKASKAVAAARETLSKMPADAGTNFVVGKHLCFFEGRWEEGLPMMAKGTMNVEATIAQQDLTPPADIKAQVAVGDAWWQRLVDYDGRERRNLMERAAAWYELAVPTLTGSEAVRLTERIAKAEAPDTVNKRLVRGSFYGRDVEDRILLLREGGGTRRSEEAVERGLDWLALHQAANGKWSTHAFQLAGKCSCTEKGDEHDVAGTAFSLLPYLGAGETQKRGRYTRTIQRGLTYLLSQQKQEGKFSDNAYENALATLAICEAYGLTKDKQLWAPAQAAVNFIVAAQDGATGSWGYSPGQKGDTSVSGWQFSALKAGHFAGLKVPLEVFSRFSGFLDQVAEPAGLGYGYNTPGAGRATSATGLLCREYFGWGPRHPLMAKGMKQMLLPENFVTKDRPSLYFLFYANQAVHHAGGEAWETWNPKVRELLIDLQDKGNTTGLEHQKGSWSTAGDEWATKGGRLMSTSLSLLILEAYYSYIPLNGNGPTLRRD